MTKHILTLAAAALLSIPTFTVAQDAPPAGDKPAPAPGGPGGGRGGRNGGGAAAFTPEAQLKRLTEQLTLTQEQQDKLKPIIAKHAEANAATRKELEGKTPEERRAAFEKSADTRKAQREEIAAVLTPEQKEKYEKMGAGGRGPGGGGRGGRGGGPGGPGGGGAGGGGDKKPEAAK